MVGIDLRVFFIIPTCFFLLLRACTCLSILKISSSRRRQQLTTPTLDEQFNVMLGTEPAQRWASPKLTRTDAMHGPAPTDSPPSHRPGGAAGLPAPLAPYIRRPYDVSTSEQVVLSKSEAERTPRRHADAAEQWAFPKLDADTTQCSARCQRTPRQHTGLVEQRASPRRSRHITTNSRRLNVGPSRAFSAASAATAVSAATAASAVPTASTASAVRHEVARFSSIEFLYSQSPLGEAN